MNKTEPTHWILQKIVDDEAHNKAFNLWPSIEKTTTSQKMPSVEKRTFSKLAIAGVVLTLLTALLLVQSPVVRAQVQQWMGQIGGVLFTVTGNYPSGEPVTIARSEVMSLAEAKTKLPFAFNLPAWSPEGYTLRDEVTVPYFGDGVDRAEFSWDLAGKPSISLLILQNPAGAENPWAVGAESIKEIMINGEAGALVRGGWDADSRQWQNDHILTLFWKHGNLTYSLSSFEPDISAADLIKMAESIAN